MLDNDIQALIDDYVKVISKNMSKSIAKMLVVDKRQYSTSVLAPFWISVTENGRKPRKSNQDSQLWKRIYVWMDKRGMFKSKTANGRINEAKSLTWYINKFGTKQFRDGVFKDVYTSETRKLRNNILSKYASKISKITSDVVKF